MATNVSIFQALQRFGYALPGNFDTTGGQTHAFRDRLIHNGVPPRVFDAVHGMVESGTNLSDPSAVGNELASAGVDTATMGNITKAIQASPIAGPAVPTGATNNGIVQTLKQMGVAIPDGFDTTGGMTSDFRDRLIHGGVPPQMFDAVKGMLDNSVNLSDQSAVRDYLVSNGLGAGSPDQAIGNTISNGLKGASPPIAFDANKAAPAQPPTPVAPPPPAAPKPGAPGGPQPGAGQPGAPGAPGRPGQPGAPKATPIPTPAKTTPDQLEAYINAKLGSAAWVAHNPEVMGVLQKLVGGSPPGTSMDTLMAAAIPQLQNTNWYKTTTSSARVFDAMNPTDQNAAITNSTDTVRQRAMALGVDLPPDKLQEMGRDSARMSWSPIQLDKAIGAEYYYSPGGAGVGATQMQVAKGAQDMLVPLSDQAKKTWSAQLMSGAVTTEDYNQYLRTQAGAQWSGLGPGLQASLDKGMTMTQILDPYTQRTASTLELDPNTIDWNQPQWNKLLNKVDSKTGQRYVPNWADVEQEIKSDPNDAYGYGKTDQARRDASELGSSMMKSFGMGV